MQSVFAKEVAYVAELLDPSLSWGAIDWLRSITRLPVLVKGIVRADDAVRAIERGAAGVVVSNHGGRQLDAAPATIEVLPRIADALGGRRGITTTCAPTGAGARLVQAVPRGAAPLAPRWAELRPPQPTRAAPRRPIAPVRRRVAAGEARPVRVI